MLCCANIDSRVYPRKDPIWQKSINGTSNPSKRGQLAPKFHVGFQKFQKIAILKIAKMAFFKKILTSALAMETSLGLDFLEVLFLFWPTKYLRITIQCTLLFLFSLYKAICWQGTQKKIHVSLAFVWPLFYASLVLAFSESW